MMFLFSSKNFHIIFVAIKKNMNVYVFFKREYIYVYMFRYVIFRVCLFPYLTYNIKIF